MISQEFTKEEVIEALGGEIKYVAEFFGITREAIYMWPDGKPIPLQRQYEIRLHRPDLLSPARRRK